MTQAKRVIVSNNLGEFFRTEVTEAKNELGIELSELAEYYVVRLCCDFSRHETAPATPGEEPLALMYKKAAEASLEQRVQILKNMGDVSLYIAGFFTDFIERSLVDLDYYIAMGGSAYSNLSGIVGQQRHGEQLGDMYHQLARKFTELVDILNEISERHHDKAERDADLLKLYDRWVRTGSHRIHKLLLERGLAPPEGLPTDYVQ